MARKQQVMGAGNSAAAANAIVGTVASGLTATGSSQADALAISAEVNEYTTVAASTGAILPANCNTGDSIFVYSIGAQTLTVYPPVGETINAIAAGSGFSVATAKTAIFVKVNATRWASLLTA